jgi:hypothetical protein
MEVIFFSETSVLTKATQRNIQEDGILHTFVSESTRKRKYHNEYYKILNYIYGKNINKRNEVTDEKGICACSANVCCWLLSI